MSDYPRIRVRGLKKSFGNRVILDGVNLDLQHGTSTVILGGSGTGKSVLLRCIIGLIEPDEGQIYIDNEDVLTASSTRQRILRQRIGLLFQNAALFDSMSVLDNILFSLKAKYKLKRTPPPSKDLLYKEALSFLTQVGLSEEIASLNPSALSGGMQKRVGLARAIAGQPDILLFDEPTTGLDPMMSAVIDSLIIKCVKQLGSTTLTITHDMTSAQRIGDQAAMLYQGRIIWQGPSQDIMKSQNHIVDQFVHGRLTGPIHLKTTSGT